MAPSPLCRPGSQGQLSDLYTPCIRHSTWYRANCCSALSGGRSGCPQGPGAWPGPFFPLCSLSLSDLILRGRECVWAPLAPPAGGGASILWWPGQGHLGGGGRRWDRTHQPSRWAIENPLPKATKRTPEMPKKKPVTRPHLTVLKNSPAVYS